MTTFNKLLAVKEGGGNPGSPGSADSLSLTLSGFASAVSTFDLTASNNSLVAFDAASLDFGNVNENPAFNFLGTGVFAVAGGALFSATGGDDAAPDFQVDGYAKFLGEVELADDLSVGGISTLTGAVQAQDTLNVTNGVTVGGTLGVTGAVDFDSTLNVDGNATFAQSATVNGNLTVLGTLVTKQTESVLISDNYIDMNSDYATVSPQDTGLTFNYSPIANATLTATDSAANTITLAANSGISLNPGDIILVTGLDAADVQNEGLYEVLTFASDVITINVASGLTFLKHAVATTLTGLTATLAHVNLGVLRVSTTGDLQYGENSDANITFGDVPYNGYVGSQAWEGSFSLDIGAGQGDALSVIGPTDLDGALNVTGALGAGASTLESLSVTNNASVGGTFGATGAATLSSTLGVTGAATLSSTLGVTGAATLSSSLDVTGAATLSSTLNVTDAATLNGAVTVDNTLSVSQGATLSSTLNVTGTSTLGVLDAGSTTLDDLVVSGGSSFSTVSASGAVILNDTLSVLLGATLSSTLDVAGNATFALAVTSNGTLTAENELIVNGDYISIAEAAAFSVPAEDTGSVYVSEDPAAAGHAELWYHGDGTANAVMITKNGQLNIDVLTFSLQAAYDDGSAIVTNSQNGAVSITAGENLTDALVVVGDASFDGAMSATGAVDFDSTLNVDGAVTFVSTLGVSGASTLDSLSVTNNASVGGTFGATGAATLSDTLAVTGNITASADVAVAGILDLDGSVDADVTAFDVLSSGSIILAATGLLNLSGSSITANLSVSAGAAIGGDNLVAMGANGLAEAQANAKDVIALGAAVSAISQGASSAGKIAEIGTVSVKAEANLVTAIVAGERLYLSASEAGRVTNVPPSASDTTVFQVGVALAGAAAGATVVLAFRPQFLYNNY